MVLRTIDEHKELLRIWDAQEKELAEFTGDIVDYLDNEVLEIRRDQYLSDGKWSTAKYTLVTGTGGPHVEFNTNHQISVFWAGRSHEYITHDDRAIRTIDAIGEYFDSIYGVETR
jgi:hypothetical protein